MSEIQQLKRDIEAHGRRLDELKREFNSRPLPKESPPPQAETLDAADERLAESIFQTTQRSRGTPGREDAADSNDEDEKLAQSIFDAAGGNTGEAEGSTEELSDEDSRLAEEIFAISGGNRTKNTTRASHEGIVPG